jgi:hypothetical protein
MNFPCAFTYIERDWDRAGIFHVLKFALIEDPEQYEKIIRNVEDGVCFVCWVSPGPPQPLSVQDPEPPVDPL